MTRVKSSLVRLSDGCETRFEACCWCGNGGRPTATSSACKVDTDAQPREGKKCHLTEDHHWEQAGT